jgi:uncharacterized membrane protein
MLEPTSELIQRNIETIAGLERAVLARRRWDDRLVDRVSAFFGSKNFVYLNALFFLGWAAFNRGSGTPDPYPYPFLTLVVSLEAIFLSIFLLISQNRQSLLTERRSHIDLQVNLLNEQETTLQMHMIVQIARHLKIDIANLPTDMDSDTDMQKLVERLERPAVPT